MPKYGRFSLNIRKNFCTVQVTERWNRLPREVVASPCLEIFRSHLDTVLDNLLKVFLHEQGLDQRISGGLFQPQPFCGSV